MNKTLLSLLLAMAMVGVIYQVGNFEAVVAYSGNEARLQFVITATLLLSFFAYWLFFFKLRLNSKPFLAACVTAFLSLLIFPSAESLQIYLVVGDYLRDFQGINIYFIDYAGWAISVFLIQLPVLAFLLTQIFEILASYPLTTIRLTPRRTKASKRKSR